MKEVIKTRLNIPKDNEKYDGSSKEISKVYYPSNCLTNKQTTNSEKNLPNVNYSFIRRRRWRCCISRLIRLFIRNKQTNKTKESFLQVVIGNPL